MINEDDETHNYVVNPNLLDEEDISALNEAIEASQLDSALIDDHDNSFSFYNRIATNPDAKKNNTKKRNLSEDDEQDEQENDLSMSVDRPKKKHCLHYFARDEKNFWLMF